MVFVYSVLLFLLSNLTIRKYVVVFFFTLNSKMTCFYHFLWAAFPNFHSICPGDFKRGRASSCRDYMLVSAHRDSLKEQCIPCDVET